MISTENQDIKFLEAILPDRDSMLLWAIDWICENLSPADVFGKKALESWAEENGYEQK